jgi:DNA-binding transcriptional regulator YhcF (GntR family)
MAFDPLDKRPLYQKVVDEITEQISSGQLKARDRVPSANEIAERYEVAAVTAQRALRELQQRGVVYGVAGKGNFVHPDAPVLLRPLELDIHTPEQYRELRDRIVGAMRSSGDRFDVEFSAAEAAGDLDRMIAVKDAHEAEMRGVFQQIGALTSYVHQMRIRGVVLEPEAEKDLLKDGNRTRVTLPAPPGPDSNIDGPWPSRDEHPEDDI